MKKIYTSIRAHARNTTKLLLAGSMLSLATAFSAKAIYVPIAVTGFTADVVANGVGAPQSTTDSTVDVATPGFYFLDSTYRFTAGGAAPLHALSPSGTIHSVGTTGLDFQLASFSGPNSLRLAATGAVGTLAFTTPVNAAEVWVLGCTGSGAGVVSITVAFTDATFQTFTNIAIPDWFAGTGFAIQGIGRVNPANSQPTGTGAATDPRLYERKVTLSAGNQSKPIASISVTRTSAVGIVNIMAVSITPGPTGISDLVNAEVSKLKVYPNPASGNFYIELADVLTKNTNVSIFNIIGEKVYATTLEKGSFGKVSINPEKHLSPGVYVVEAIVNEQVSRERIVIK